MRKIQIYRILFLISFWVFCVIFIVFYDSAVLGFKPEFPGRNYNFLFTLITSILICIIGASLLASLEVLYLSKLLRKKPFGLTLLIKTAVYLLFMIFFISITEVYLTSVEIKKPIFSKEVLDIFLMQILNVRILMQVVYWGLACLMALFILQVNDKFGQGILINMLRGKYHQPKEEEKIFMFMDLKSSTKHAEKLGHIKYSRLIQDCFFDITDVVTKFEAKIYQYVGDEVVLSWSVNNGINKGNCIQTFIDYGFKIKNKQQYYKDMYGFIPEFKAGLHLGNVTVAEVGEIKKELAYHGDVLNTASRIQGKCNDLKQKILISEPLKNALESVTQFKFSLIDNVLLRGKEKAINIFTVETI